jgi:hypothetical protein
MTNPESPNPRAFTNYFTPMPNHRVFLLPMTDEAKTAINAGILKIDHFPFRFGRESRTAARIAELSDEDRRMMRSTPNNDFYLLDTGRMLNISREHFQIERNEATHGYEIFDRGSTCGTAVNNIHLGNGTKETRAEICDGYLLVVGTYKSRFVFKFKVVNE